MCDNLGFRLRHIIYKIHTFDFKAAMWQQKDTWLNATRLSLNSFTVCKSISDKTTLKKRTYNKRNEMKWNERIKKSTRVPYSWSILLFSSDFFFVFFCIYLKIKLELNIIMSKHCLWLFKWFLWLAKRKKAWRRRDTEFVNCLVTYSPFSIECIIRSISNDNVNIDKYSINSPYNLGPNVTIDIECVP